MLVSVFILVLYVIALSSACTEMGKESIELERCSKYKSVTKRCACNAILKNEFYALHHFNCYEFGLVIEDVCKTSNACRETYGKNNAYGLNKHFKPNWKSCAKDLDNGLATMINDRLYVSNKKFKYHYPEIDDIARQSITCEKDWIAFNTCVDSNKK